MKSGAELLKAWMGRMGLNLTQTAAELEMQLPYLSMIASGKRNPGLRAAVKIERRTGIPAEAWLATEVYGSSADATPVAANDLIHKG
jgi:transcriptional regulator with XRE-family HTH domain